MQNFSGSNIIHSVTHIKSSATSDLIWAFIEPLIKFLLYLDGNNINYHQYCIINEINILRLIY